MNYFIVNLAAHILLIVVFIVLACVFAGRNKKKKTKHVVSYFFPIVFALVALLDIIFCAAPRLLDINSLVNSNYFYNTGTVEKIGFIKNYFVVDGTYYYVNPLHNNLNEGDRVRVKHTQYSGFTVDWTLVTDTEQEENNNGTDGTES